MFAEPLNVVPLIARPVCKVVAVEALPVRVPVIPPLNVARPEKVLVELKFVSNW